MYEYTRNTHKMLNDMSSVQISSMALVVLMILSVTQLSFLPPRYKPCNPRQCVGHLACMNINFLNRSFIPSKAMLDGVESLMVLFLILITV